MNKHQWNEWYAWKPIRMKGKWVWLKKVYRRCINTYVDYDDWNRYEYGTLFDVIETTGNNQSRPLVVGEILDCSPPRKP